MAAGDKGERRTAVLVLGTVLLVVLVALITENAFNIQSFSPGSTGSILVYSSISLLGFLLFLTVLVLLLRNILKLYLSERSRVLGPRLRTRMLMGALLLSLMPVFFMVFFNYLLMNRSIDRWFAQPGLFLRERSMQVAMEMAHYAADNARVEAASIAHNIAQAQQRGHALSPQKATKEMQRHKITLQDGFALLFQDDKLVASFQMPPLSGPAMVGPWSAPKGRFAPVPAGQDIAEAALRAALHTDGQVLQVGDTEYALGLAQTENGATVVVGLPMPPGVGEDVRSIRSGTQTYWTLFRARRRIRDTYLQVLMLLSVLTFFISSWLALFLSKQITRPVEVLADSMETIASGDYGHRADIAASGELGELVRSFNQMAADLETSHAQLEASARQLADLNAALESRRKELETVMETIPSAVVVLDEQLRIVHANRAFYEMLDPLGEQNFVGRPLLDFFPAEAGEEIQRVVRRSLRLASASTEVETRTARGPLELAFTTAQLQGANGRGHLVVLDDVTDLLLVQKQTAWKEVAQRVAHEIKNPLTPIVLSAERIQRHLGRPETPLPEEFRQMAQGATDVILASVETLRLLVEQFSSLADFPVAHPQPVDLNQIVEGTLKFFTGRLQDIELRLHRDTQLPLVLADHEALKRALTNLVDNAAEAMQDSLVRVLTIQTGLNESQTMAEIVVADTGHGLTDEVRERLFLPFFSTRRRGTGLGLSIAAKIVQEHHGTIRAEKALPAGTRFIIELPLAEAVQPETPDPEAEARTGA